jgi:radical SAM protein with 4Fe4S-binding SPASM domain
MNKVYKKFNSFLELKVKKRVDQKFFLGQLKRILDTEINRNSFSKKEKKIFNQILIDLFNPPKKSYTKFSLTPNVIKEIQTLKVEQIINYLIHRYRYEIYPQMQIKDDYPPYLQIEPTSICNYRCVFCYQTDNAFNKRSQGYMGHMSFDTFKLIVDQAEENIEFISLASRGEPLLCPDIKKMLFYTKDKFLNLKINTNASLLDEKMSYAILESGVKTLVFSADAADSKLYGELRVNGKFEKIVKNIEKFQEIRSKHFNSKIITRVSGVKVKKEQKIEKMNKFWNNLADQVAFVDYVPWENVYQSKKINIKKPCSDLWRRMFIWWNGDTNSCDVDYKSTLMVGNIKYKNINELWNSERYVLLRNKHNMKKRKQISPCNRCNVV